MNNILKISEPISFPTGQNITISDVINEQSKLRSDGSSGFICPNCIHHKGGVGCNMNHFISFVGAYTEGCTSFKQK